MFEKDVHSFSNAKVKEKNHDEINGQFHIYFRISGKREQNQTNFQSNPINTKPNQTKPKFCSNKNHHVAINIHLCDGMYLQEVAL